MQGKRYSVGEVAERIGVDYQRIYYAVVTGRIEAEKIGRTHVLTEADVQTLKALFEERDSHADAFREV